jgi:flagella basal body P-ring formation protein FlgA
LEQFAVRRIDVTEVPEALLTDPAQLTRARSRLDLMPDRFVPLSRVETIPDVISGATVTIIAAGGALEIEARGVALQNGLVGETIQVRNADSKKILSGRVTAPGVVTVTI